MAGNTLLRSAPFGKIRTHMAGGATTRQIAPIEMKGLDASAASGGISGGNSRQDAKQAKTDH